MGAEATYVGTELELFLRARNWKRYLRAEIDAYVRGDVLEVGAGLGGTTAALHDGGARTWVCLEPDLENAKRLRHLIDQRWRDTSTHVIVGSLRCVAHKPSFDCVLYIDVLEHIRDDRFEIEAATRLVRNGGHLVILAPAHQWLFSEFDRSIGHLRRYNKPRLQALMPAGWVEKKIRYLDCVGALLSLGNALILRRSMPTPLQVAIWDRWCVPVSRLIDPLVLGTCGKSILAVWQKEGEGQS
ncbi:MAG TPA: methyltransferase domain-containing protein [Candidatus Eisenbacteria bacterium]|nr:methyltransferase domain-containing protein [Candidatus Eisenbacteria bacterium]